MTFLNVHLRRRFLYISIASIIIGTATTAAAEEDLIEISEGQLDLNERGIESVQEEDYERALRLFRASLDLGELNITYVNLGRVYQHAGDCESADEIFDQAMDAPQVDEPSPEQVEGAIEMYREEMEDNCPGYLKLECDPEEMALFVDGQGPLRCQSDEPRHLMPDRYELRGEYLDFETTQTVQISAMEDSRVSLSLAEEELDEITRVEVEEKEEMEEADDALEEFEAHVVEIDEEEAQEGEDVVEEPAEQQEELDEVQSDEEFAEIDPPPSPEGSGSAGVLLLTTSALSLAGAVMLDTIPDQASNGEFNTINFVAVGLYGSALGLGVAGIRSTW